jgi:DNA-binding MarR family transcriptional regulator
MFTNDDMQAPENWENWIGFVQGLSPETDPMATRIIDDLRQVAGLLHRISENSLAPSRLSSAKYRLLMDLLYIERVHGRWELSPSEISKRQGTSRNTASTLISDLARDGLVERQLDQSDRRRFHIWLTDAGRAEVQANAGIHLRAITGCFDVPGQDDKEHLGRLLAKLSRYPRQGSRSGATPNDIR